MKKLFKLSIVVASILAIVSCGQELDKKAQLEKMKQQYSELGQKIKQLETELGVPQVAVERSVNVETKSVALSEFNHYIEIQGKVDGENNVAVSPQIPGIVTQLYVKEGTVVKKGQVLAQLDDSVVRQQLNVLNQQLDFATNLYQKQKNLWEKEIGSEVQYLSAKNQKESLEKNLQVMKEQLEMYKIKAPINGTVEEVGVKIGQMSAAGVLPAFRVVNFSSAKVVADVAEAYAPKVKSGSKAVVYFPDFDKEITSTLNFSSKYINPVNRTFMVEIKLGKGEVDYRANMLAVVKIADYTNPSTIVLPVNLVKDSQDGNYVFVIEDVNGKTIAKRRYVKTGQTYNGLAEITEGLKEGDRIINKGQNDLSEGQLVKIVN